MMMNRREVLQRVAALMGGAVSAPAILGVLSGCSAKQSSGSVSWKPLLLTPEQAVLVGEIAEMIIPRTDTPGAKDAGVPEFIDRILNDVYPKSGQERFISGLQAFEAGAHEELGKPFLKLDDAQRARFLQKIHDAAVFKEEAEDAEDPGSRRPFVLMMKELTLLGFFTSQPGATQVLQYVPIPGALHSCIPLAQAGNGRAWTQESTAWFE
jgi:gluconate 2-dehydrogenase gamma chain